MEMLDLAIPASFIKQRLGRPTWQEVQFGLENELIDPAAITELAGDDLAQDDPPPQTLELAISAADEPKLDLVKQLASNEAPDSDRSGPRAWLFLVLAWLYEHRETLADPLASVELVYADFDYPEQVSGFVRYMPSEAPDLGDRTLNEQRLLDRWAAFIDQERSTLSRA